jgi:hypothetical protein
MKSALQAGRRLVRLAAGLLGLLGAPHTDAASLTNLLPAWSADFIAAGKHPDADVRLHPARHDYYHKAFEAMLDSNNAVAILWPLLQTWTLAACALPADQRSGWQQTCQSLGLLGADFEERVAALDHYLDQIEELLEEKAAENGLNIEETL